MNSHTTTLILLNIIVFCFGMGGWYYKKQHGQPQQPMSKIIRQGEGRSTLPPAPPNQQQPIQNKISKVQPSYMNYTATVAQLKQWNQEAPEMTEVGTYGKSAAGADLYYLRLNNKRTSGSKPVVLITACIHGNEPLCSSTTMWYIGDMLDKYGKDEEITQIVDSRDIYFVPVVSPDSYPNRRQVDGVDPNRDFPSPSRPNHRSCAPVQAIQDLFNRIKPKAAMSGHTWGRVYLTPYGDTMTPPPNHDQITLVMNKMKALSGYRCIRACEMYQQGGGLNNPPIRTMGRSWGKSVPIHGGDVDWYYRGGAFSIVCEYGTHQRIPTDDDTRQEFTKTYKAFLVFLKEAPLVTVTPQR